MCKVPISRSCTLSAWTQPRQQRESGTLAACLAHRLSRSAGDLLWRTGTQVATAFVAGGRVRGALGNVQEYAEKLESRGESRNVQIGLPDRWTRASATHRPSAIRQVMLCLLRVCCAVENTAKFDQDVSPSFAMTCSTLPQRTLIVAAQGDGTKSPNRTES